MRALANPYERLQCLDLQFFISPLMIIHGHGTGAVKSAVREYLSKSTYAKSFRRGEIYEGGDGVTVVDL